LNFTDFRSLSEKNLKVNQGEFQIRVIFKCVLQLTVLVELVALSFNL
jgi:hypothetical protein